MELSLLQAILLGLYYWFAVWYMGYSVLFVFTGPLFTAMICGFVLGDVSTAMKIGATIQPMFLAFTAAGGTAVWDETAATISAAAPSRWSAVCRLKVLLPSPCR